VRNAPPEAASGIKTKCRQHFSDCLHQLVTSKIVPLTQVRPWIRI